MTRCIVYALMSTRDNFIRYVGQTPQSLYRRLIQHRSYAKCKRTAVHKWMNREQSEGFTILIKELVDKAEFNLDEQEIIKQYRANGYRLLNHTDGGEGTLGFSANKGRKRPDLSIRNKMNVGKPGRPMSEDNKKKLRAAVTGARRPYLSERNRTSKVWVGRKHTEETKQNMRLAKLGKVVSEETRLKLSRVRKAKGIKLSADAIAKLREGHRLYHEQRRASV